jgi:hypothetical protein
MTEEEYSSFHVRDPKLHEMVYKIQQRIKNDHGPKVKVPYHLIIKYYLKKLCEHADSYGFGFPFQNLMEFTALDDIEENEDFKKLEEILDATTG